MTPSEFWKVVLPVITLGLSSLYKWLKERKAIDSPKPPPRLLLAVEDNNSDVYLLTGVLKQTDVQYEIATSAEEAWFLFAERRHHIVLIDMRLPLMDGWDFAKRVRRHSPSVFVAVMVTNTEDLGKLEVGQFYGLIRKPVTLEAIEQMIAKVK